MTGHRVLTVNCSIPVLETDMVSRRTWCIAKMSLAHYPSLYLESVLQERARWANITLPPSAGHVWQSGSRTGTDSSLLHCCDSWTGWYRLTAVLGYSLWYTKHFNCNSNAVEEWLACVSHSSEVRCPRIVSKVRWRLKSSNGFCVLVPSRLTRFLGLE